jgi:predicted ATP-dependent endonuclease of OLD family
MTPSHLFDHERTGILAMRIQKIAIRNFRAFKEETITLNAYSCLVGPNGAGKSTVLAALNVFFQDKSSAATDVTKLIHEDYFCGDTSEPVQITVTFAGLSDEAKTDLAAYVQDDALVVTAKADFDVDKQCGIVKHYGHRQGIEAFHHFFELYKAKAPASDLKDSYEQLQSQLEFQELSTKVKSKDDRYNVLREFEKNHPEQCVPMLSEDSFYNSSSQGKLSKHVQWVYVPAVKDASEEEQESKNTALGKLLERAVSQRSDIEQELEELRARTRDEYQQLLQKHGASLQDISDALQNRLTSWAHNDVRLSMAWDSDSEKSVTLQAPVARIKTGEGDFLGSLARMGHGLQRSYIIALLQELAELDGQGGKSLILGIEEPELYQHPPQARHLADVLEKLTEGDAQVVVTTHSPLFVSGNGFENIRVVQASDGNDGAKIKSLTFDRLCNRLREIRDEEPKEKTAGLVAKIHQALQPNIAEMFFARTPILVEGLEDVSYITTHLHLSEFWTEFRRLGCHLIPVHGKDKLIQPLAIAKELDIPVFIIFDADGNTEREDHRRRHEKDNKALMELLGINQDEFPEENVWSHDCAIWPTNLTEVVKADFGDKADSLQEKARTKLDQEKDLHKNDFFIAEWLTRGMDEGLSSATLQQLCERILAFAQR